MTGTRQNCNVRKARETTKPAPVRCRISTSAWVLDCANTESWTQSLRPSPTSPHAQHDATGAGTESIGNLMRLHLENSTVIIVIGAFKAVLHLVSGGATLC